MSAEDLEPVSSRTRAGGAAYGPSAVFDEEDDDDMDLEPTTDATEGDSQDYEEIDSDSDELNFYGKDAVGYHLNFFRSNDRF